MTYWQSTKSPVHMFKRIYEGTELKAHLLDNAGIDSAIISDALQIPHLNWLAVAAYQRRLGVRAVIHTGRKSK